MGEQSTAQAAAPLRDRGAIITFQREQRRALLTIRQKGGATKTDIQLIRRLAVYYDDGKIAGILNRQARRSATSERFTAIIVGGLRGYRQIPQATDRTPEPGHVINCPPRSRAMSPRRSFRRSGPTRERPA